VLYSYGRSNVNTINAYIYIYIYIYIGPQWLVQFIDWHFSRIGLCTGLVCLIEPINIIMINIKSNGICSYSLLNGACRPIACIWLRITLFAIVTWRMVFYYDCVACDMHVSGICCMDYTPIVTSYRISRDWCRLLCVFFIYILSCYPQDKLVFIFASCL